MNRQEFVQHAVLGMLRGGAATIFPHSRLVDLLTEHANKLADRLFPPETGKSYILVSHEAPGCLEGCFDNEEDMLKHLQKLRAMGCSARAYEVSGHSASSYQKWEDPMPLLREKLLDMADRWSACGNDAAEQCAATLREALK